MQESLDNRIGRQLLIERTTRITTGLILMSFAATHFLSHAMGLFFLDRMERIGHGIVMAPWRTEIGRWTLLVALLTHLGLGLWTFWRRRHLRWPPIQSVQLALGLCIPLLIIPHAVDARLGYSLYGLEDSYYRILYRFWITSPAADLTRQFLLLLVLWAHGCIGLHIWLRYRRWYARWSGFWLAGAIALPVLALAGIMNGGWDLRLRTIADPGFSALYGAPAPGTPGAEHAAELDWLGDALRATFIAVLVAILAARLWRYWADRRGNGVTLRYLGQATVTVPRGFSILEASHFRRIPHLSLCGGKARCSTCRVRIVRGLENLPAPNAMERATLDRIKAPQAVRLACQTRPAADVTLAPLLTADAARGGLSIAYEHGDERTVTALAVDLRDSTRLAAGRLPFDTLFIINRFVKIVSAAIAAQGGYVTSVAGDGIMSVFGMDASPADGARRALAAAIAIWEALVLLERDLAEELQFPLRFGMGVHTGVAVVGAIALSGRSSVQFLGDTGNIASRLEAASKDLGAVTVVSEAVVAAAELARPADVPVVAIPIRGLEATAISVVAIRARDEIAALLQSKPAHDGKPLVLPADAPVSPDGRSRS